MEFGKQELLDESKRRRVKELAFFFVCFEEITFSLSNWREIFIKLVVVGLLVGLSFIILVNWFWLYGLFWRVGYK